MYSYDEFKEGCSVIIENTKYKILGLAYYVTQTDTENIYAKILLNDHYVLVVALSDNIAYFGRNFGEIKEFSSFSESIEYGNKRFEQVNSDYQILKNLVFGSPLEVEGEVMFWDYESGNNIISIAIVSRTRERADVVARYVDIKDIEIIE